MDRSDPGANYASERGLSPSRSSVVSSTAATDTHFPLGPGDNGSSSGMRRRSSVPHRLAALTDLGGPNSIRSFTRSWQRAANFPEVLPHRPSLAFAPDQEPLVPESQYPRSNVEPGPREWTSLIGQHLEAGPGPSGRRLSGGAGREGRDRGRKAIDAELENAFYTGSEGSEGSRRPSMFGAPPDLSSSPIVGSYGSHWSHGSHRSYGTAHAELERLSSRASWGRRGEENSEEEVPPMLVKEIEQDGKFVLAVEGQSTLPQTIFNSINVLVGVGLLSLPLGIKYAGWVCGMFALLCCAAVTAYTAKLLGRCMDLDPSLITFSDIAYISYGPRARVATSILFTLELVAANVALVVLFADSMELLFPGLMTAVMWKLLCVLVLLPLSFLPLRLLSFTSIIGIFSCFGIVAIVAMDGLLKRHSPGSLLEPAATHLFPRRWSTLPLSFGLLLSPWGGHSVFPNIYRDMRHPHKYGKALWVTYIFTILLDATTAAVGILMFGDDVREAITSNILRTTGYPISLTILMCAFIAVIPLTKVPLNARPVVNTVEHICGVHHHHPLYPNERQHGETYRSIVRGFARVLVLTSFFVIAVVFPAFDSIMAFMGSALCFSICVILPLAFYLRLFKFQISTRERLVAYFLITASSILSVMGTIWAFLPKNLIGAV